MRDALLAFWLLLDVLWDAVVLGFTAWMVFFRGHSGWWFLLAIICCSSTSLYKALRKRFEIPEESE
jgi:hypothetical protein